MESYYIITNLRYSELTKEEYYLLLDSVMENKDRIAKIKESYIEMDDNRQSRTIKIFLKNFFDNCNTSITFKIIRNDERSFN